MTHPPTEITAASLRRRPAIAGAVSLVLGIALGALVLLRGNAPLWLDAPWMAWIAQLRSPIGDVPFFALNLVGSGWATTVATLALAVVLLVARRSWTTLYVAAAVITSALVVHGLKAAFGRVRPEDTMLSLESGSFPSGHVAYAATLVVVIAVVTRRQWVVLVGSVYVVLMALSRTYLGAHWVSDTVGGLLVGAGVGLLVLAPFARRIRIEAAGRAPVAPAQSATL